jgi:hypothetical protein
MPTFVKVYKNGNGELEVSRVKDASGFSAPPQIVVIGVDGKRVSFLGESQARAIERKKTLDRDVVIAGTHPVPLKQRKNQAEVRSLFKEMGYDYVGKRKK